MKIIYSDHAKKRMKERGIEDWEVEHTLKFPIYTKKNSEGKIEAVAEIRNRRIKIIFVNEEKYIKIITVI